MEAKVLWVKLSKLEAMATFKFSGQLERRKSTNGVLLVNSNSSKSEQLQKTILVANQLCWWIVLFRCFTKPTTNVATTAARNSTNANRVGIAAMLAATQTTAPTACALLNTRSMISLT